MFLILYYLIVNVRADKIVSTHFWDCNGGSCDSRTLQPWNIDNYRYSVNYAPLDPNGFGGSRYGEKIWMTGAASDGLTKLLGKDDSCCGSDPDGGGGCGKCLLVTNPDAVQSSWKVLVMKKNRCPPWSNGCENDKLHLDLAVPGYDNLQFSTANICGKSNTIISKEESSICGDWYNRGSSTIEGCQCDSLPETSESEKKLKLGCQLFTQWGWKSGNPKLNYQIVECPSQYTSLIGDSFGPDGPTNQSPSLPTPKLPTSLPTPKQPTSLPTPSLKDWYCNWNNCNGVRQGGEWCNFQRDRCLQCGGKICEDKIIPTRQPTPSLKDWYCNWNKCNGEPQGGEWCGRERKRCLLCGGKVCENR